MRRLLPFLLTFVLALPMFVSAQSVADGHLGWDFESVFPPDTSNNLGSVHGLAYDADGEVWAASYYATDSVEVTYTATDGSDSTAYEWVRVIYIYEEDGTPSDTIKFVNDMDGNRVDTLGGFLNAERNWEGRSMRGMRADNDGNIIVSQWLTLYKFDAETHQMIAKASIADEHGFCAMTAAAVDGSNNVYVASVCPGSPILQLPSDLSSQTAVVNDVPGFARSLEVSEDAMTIFAPRYSVNAVLKFTKPDEFSAFGAADTVLKGLSSETVSYNPVSGNIWFGSGNKSFNAPNGWVQYDNPDFATYWDSTAWYAFDPATIDGDEYAAGDAIDSLKWSVAQDTGGVFDQGRPRALTFATDDGKTAWVGQFSQPAPAAQMFTTDELVTSIGGEDVEVPNEFSLKQNYPNPFNPSTKITYSVGTASKVKLTVYDMLGREVATLVNQTKRPGEYTVNFNASNLSSGVYIYSLNADGQTISKKMTLMK